MRTRKTLCINVCSVRQIVDKCLYYGGFTPPQTPRRFTQSAIPRIRLNPTYYDVTGNSKDTVYKVVQGKFRYIFLIYTH